MIPTPIAGFQRTVSHDSTNPCLTCGACCAYFRVSFYWAEADDAKLGGVPVAMTERVGVSRLAMRGTTASQPRCVALTGAVGQCVSCTIHPSRSSTCREFEASWQNGKANADCDKARAAYGLPPLVPPAPDSDDDTPRPLTPVKPKRKRAA